MRPTLTLAICLMTGAASAQIMEPGKQQRLTALLPRLADKEFNAYLTDPRVLWYTNAEMPAAYQHAIGNGYVQTTLHSPFYNISGDPSDRGAVNNRPGDLGRRGGGNGNVEFPWNVAPGGAANSPSVNSFKGLWLPKDDSGRLRPVVWFRQDVPGRGAGERIVRGGGGLAEGPPRRLRDGRSLNYAYGWTFPPGAVLIEALTMRTPNDTDVVFAIRFRVREPDAWGVEIFRPFATAEQLAAAIESFEGRDVRREAAIAQLRAAGPLTEMRLADLTHTRKLGFDVTTGTCDLPTLSTDDVLSLINRPFVSCLGEKWKVGTNGVAALAATNPTNNFNVIPPNFHGAFAGNDRDGCIKCHDSTNRHVTEFEQPRGWYGRIRGSDGIFSFHPFDPRSISYAGGALPVRISGRLEAAGIVAAYNPSMHPGYQRIEGIY